MAKETQHLRRDSRSLLTALRSLVAGWIFLALLASACNAQGGFQLLDYTPFAGYSLGDGILGNDFAEPLSQCITGPTKPLPASHSDVRVSIVYSAYEYKQAFHIDQKAEASVLKIGSGGEELHIGQVTGSSGSAFDIIVEGYSERDGEAFEQVTWDSPYKEMMESGDPAKIRTVREACGDRYIRAVFYDARLFVVLHVSSQKKSSLTTFSGKASGKIGIDALSASTELGGDANISSANQSGAIKIEIASEGLGGMVPTAAAIRIASSDGLIAIADKLSTYVSTLPQTRGQPVKYQLAALPLMPKGDLTNERIFDDLNDLKSAYLLSNSRLANVTTLLDNDPRRIVFRQPDADKSLATQKAVLSKYVDAAVVAHDKCSKATELTTCSDVTSNLGSPPPVESVELPPIAPPRVGLYVFAIDGVVIAPGQSGRLISNNAGTLFDAAKAINPSAVNVDVLAGIPSAYVSHIDVVAIKPQPPYAPLVVGGGRLLSQDLSWPPYFPVQAKTGAVVPVLHADAQHPCPISNVDGLNVFDASCLTSVGQMLRDVALTDAAYHAAATNGSPQTYNFPMGAMVQDCFAPPTFSGMGTVGITVTPSTPVGINVAPSPSRKVSAKVSFFVPMPGLALPLLLTTETYDVATWTQLAATRLASLKVWQSGAAAVFNPCGPHIP